MERKILLCNDQTHFSTVREILEEGWVLDPSIYDGKPMCLENAIVYHLVKYGEGEEPSEIVEPLIESIKSIAINEADEFLAKGYEIKDAFAKTVTLIKHMS